MIRAKIAGIGSFVPPHRMTNPDFEKIVDTSDEWITTRTGIKERRICQNESNSDMAVAASRRALEMAGIEPAEIDLIMVATVTPDYRLPSAACIVQQKLGLINAAATDIVAACAGFLYGLSTAELFIRCGKYKNILVIGVEKLSSITDYTDRNTCVLFGDGAGAAVLTPTEDDSGILSTFMKSDGRLGELLWIPDGGSNNPLQNINRDNSLQVFIKMNGGEVFKHAVRQMDDACRRVLDEAGLTTKDVDWLVAHQANYRIITSTAKRLGIPMEKVYVNIEKYGNTSSASVPLAIDEAYREGKIKKGNLILMTAIGGGLAWAAAAYRW
jgi:3-oxoacyl-[acyl-carrier-protein] synthase III